MSMKLAVTLVALLSACGGGKTSTTFLPSADLAQTGDADIAASGTDLATMTDHGPANGFHDLAQSVPVDMSVAGPVDMAHALPDLAMCAFVPPCGAGGQSDCCNGAATCINGNCLNGPGQPCNVDPGKGPVVLCYAGSQGVPSGQCGAGGKCMP